MGLPSNTNALQNGFAQGYQIGRSLRFRNSASAYLSRTPSVASGFNQWTLSVWLKRCDVNGSVGSQYIIGGNTTSSGFRNEQKVEITSSGQLFVGAFNNGGGYYFYRFSSNLLRDPSAWYHIVVQFDPDNATSANKIIAYINGIQVTWGSSADSGVSGSITSSAYRSINNTYRNDINGGYQSGGGPVYFSDNYLAEMIMVSGSLISPSSFGVYDSNGIWQPIKYTGTYGTNGFYLPFSNTTSTTTLVADASGNGNNWTANNISLTAGSPSYDSMIDSPTNSASSSNYPVMNVLSTYSSVPSNGNLALSVSNNTGGGIVSTMALPTTGKWYWEITAGLTSGGTNTNGPYIGIVPSSYNPKTGSAAAAPSNGYLYLGDGTKNVLGTQSAYGSTWTDSTSSVYTIGVAYDAGAGTIVMYRNNVSQGTLASGISGEYIAVSGNAQGGAGACSLTYNFGQQGFFYTPPSGYSALNTYNLPTPTIKNGALYNAATLYTGNGTSQTITNGGNNPIGVTFQPDFVWAKIRSTTGNHSNYDSVRGAQQWISTNLTNAEGTYPGVTAFNSNGFSIGSDGGVNTNAATYVAWQWKAGGSSSSNTSGSITSTVSVNTTAGFSVVTYTGNGVNNATVGHGLGVTPSMVIVKIRSNNTGDWPVKHSSLSSNNNLRLNLTNAQSTLTGFGYIGDLSSSTTFSLVTGTSFDNVNANSQTYVAYCFSAVKGYSSFGTYTGNGSTDGPFVYTGFRPRWVMFKRTDATGSWNIIDTSRLTYNLDNLSLQPDNSGAELTFTTANSPLDILSNGFKLRGTGNDGNVSGGTYIYAAFAENPFSIARAR